MLVGFIHGVMNTDNMTISGETIDYGPCAFMDAYDPATVFSSIDLGGRYAYGNQPKIAQWNLARLAEAMLPLFGDDADSAVATVTPVLQSFTDRFQRYWSAGDAGQARPRRRHARHRPADHRPAGPAAGRGRRPHRLLPGPGGVADGRRRAGARSLFAEPADVDEWAARWRAALAAEGRPPEAVAAAMDRVNPLYIPRNHLVEDALAAATAGDLEPFRRLLDVLARPYDERPGLEAYAAPAPVSTVPYRTFCGT